MDIIKYDILDELTEPREINAAQAVVEQDVDPKTLLTPEEFYIKLKELWCTNLFIINLHYDWSPKSVNEIKSRLQEIRNHYLGECEIDVQPVGLYRNRWAIRVETLSGTEEFLVTDGNASYSEPWNILFKIPVKIGLDKSDRLVKKICNFFACLYSIIQPYTDETNYEGIVDVRTRLIGGALSNPSKIHSWSFYAHKFTPVSLYENNHDPNVAQTGLTDLNHMTIELFEAFCRRNAMFDRFLKMRLDDMKSALKNWIGRYSPKTEMIDEEIVRDIVDANNDVFYTQKLEVNNRRYTIISC